MLHERVKAYKKRLYEEHAMNLAHERHILRLHDDIKRLQDLVEVGSQPKCRTVKAVYVSCVLRAQGQWQHFLTGL